jgi:hypothetical protein
MDLQDRHPKAALSADDRVRSWFLESPHKTCAKPFLISGVPVGALEGAGVSPFWQVT